MAWEKSENSPKRLTGRAGIRDRQRIKLRDKFICQICGMITAELEIDHIVPFSKGGEDADSNKRSLCVPCHSAKSERERGVIRKSGCDELGIPSTWK